MNIRYTILEAKNNYAIIQLEGEFNFKQDTLVELNNKIIK